MTNILSLASQNDKLELIKSGSLQHLGENVLAFLLRVASSSDLPKDQTLQGDEKSNLDSAVYFDILVISELAILLFVSIKIYTYIVFSLPGP